MSQNILPQHRRKLWVLERNNVHRNFVQGYNNFNVTGVYNHEIDASKLSNALRNLILRYPILASNAFRDASSTEADDKKLDYKNFSVYPVESISLDNVVSWGEIEDFDADVLRKLEQVRIPVNTANLPLWRIQVNRCQKDGHQYITFLCDHATFDGSSAHLFHQDLLGELSNLSDSVEVKKTIFSYDEDFEKLAPLLPLPKSVHHRLYEPTLWQKLVAILKAVCPGWLTKLVKSFLIPGHPNLWKNPQFSYDLSSVSQPETDYHFIKFTPDVSKRIVQKCRQLKLTVTPLLYRVGISALEDSVFRAIAPETRFSSVPSIVMDGRRFFPDLSDTLKYNNVVGCFNPTLGPQPSFYERKDGGLSTVSTIFLQSVSLLTQQLHQNVKGTTNFSMIGLLRWTNLSQYEKQARLNNEKQTMEVSNLGFRNYQSGDWKVIDLIFSQSIGFSLNFGLSVVSTADGGMNIVVGFNKKFNDLPGDQTKQFAHLLEERLLHFSQLP